jgi:hypothetical protein
VQVGATPFLIEGGQAWEWYHPATLERIRQGREMGKVIKGKWDKGPAGKEAPSGEAVSKEKVFQLHISLEETDPVIWRRFLVRGTVTLAKLHRIIQGVMGWTDTHLHEFAIGNVSYGEPDPEMDPAEGVKNERRMHLYQVAPRPAAHSCMSMISVTTGCTGWSWRKYSTATSCFRGNPSAWRARESVLPRTVAALRVTTTC